MSACALRSPVARAAGALLLVVAGAACAPPRPPAAPPPAPVSASAAEIDALATLLRLEDQRRVAADTLAALARDSSALVRARTALALGRLRDPRGLAPLLRLLEDRDSSVAATAAFALGQLGDTAAVPALVPLLTAERAARTPTVGAEAAYALGRLRTPGARAALRRLLAQAPLGDAALREVVASALLAVWRHPRDDGADAIRRWLGVPEPELRWRAAYALVRRPDPAATPTLLGLLQDPDTAVRALAARGVTGPLVDSAGLGRDAAVAALRAALSSGGYQTRINAARSLGSFGSAAAVDALLPLVRGADRHAALTAVEALGRIGAPARAALDSLAGVVHDASAPVALRRAALEASAAIDPGEAGVLARHASSSPHWRMRAGAARAVAIANGPDAAVEGFLRDPDPRVGAAAMQAALDAAGNSPVRLRSALLGALGMPDVMVRTAALNGLARLADPSTLPALLDAYARAQRDTLNDAALAAMDAVAALQDAGLQPERAFFARFPRPDDPLLRLRARERFRAAADRAWGEPLPIETGRTPEEYRWEVQRWVAPGVEGRGRPVAEIHTVGGVIRVRLLADLAPLTVESFVRLAERGYFDGQEWPRVVPNFVVQGGDPRGDTSGGPGYTLRDELNRRRYGVGTVGMALSGPDTGGSQFFITHSPQPHLDGVYTVFGEVMEGQAITQTLLPGDAIIDVRILP